MECKDLFNKESNGAIFSLHGKYRYVLWRIWNNNLPKIMFIGLNPSTANGNNDDPTIRKVKKIAYNLKYGGIFMLNLFTYVTAYPKELEGKNFNIKLADEYLKYYASQSKKIVFAWGSFKQTTKRSKEVINMFPNAYALHINKDGSPKHPLYVKSDTKLIKYINQLEK